MAGLCIVERDGRADGRVGCRAGGGGAKSEERKGKLVAKNEKLNEQRKRRALEEEKASRKANKGKVSTGGADAAVEDAGDVHPSRRARVPQG